jgi:histidine triad (HIT) family protein
MRNDCVFCAIVDGEIPSFKIYEDDTAIAFLDINPFSYGHALVVPKVHREGLLDAEDGELAALMAVVKKVAAAIKAELKCDGFNILQNNGEAAGQSVKHIHFHIVPRMNGGAVTFESGAGDMEELAALAQRLKMN